MMFGYRRSYENLWEVVSCRISFSLGNGRKVKFWIENCVAMNL